MITLTLVSCIPGHWTMNETHTAARPARRRVRSLSSTTPNKKRQIDTRVPVVSDFYRDCALVVLPEDCRLYCLKFLTREELHGSYALVSKRCRDDSRNPIFSQTKTAHISCGDTCSVTGVLELMMQCHNRGIFETPRTRLKLSGHQKLDKITMGNMKIKNLIHFGRYNLGNVKSLDLSFEESTFANERIVQNCIPKIMSMMLPKLTEVDMSYMRVRHTAAADFCSRHRKSLQIFHWNGASGGFSFSGQDLRHCKNLRELYLDNACMYSPENSYTKESMLKHCNSNLQRVSIKNVSYKLFCQRTARNMPEEKLMHFVRATKNLKWFRSDLSPENVAILKEERPEICFTT